MNRIRFSYQETALVTLQEMSEALARLAPEIARVKSAWNGGYSTPYGCIQLPLDSAIHTDVTQLVQEKNSYKLSLTIVIGIGGSNLGAMAVYEAIMGTPLYCADSVDSFFTRTLYVRAEKELERGNNILLIVISKSGSTTETIANAELFTSLLKKYRERYNDYIVVISDAGSKLIELAQKNNIAHLTIPALVGGRYCVLSAAGLFPLALLGIDTKEFCAGAASVRDFTGTAGNDSVAISAAIAFVHAAHGVAIYDRFFFVSRLNGLGLWLRQLFAESLGKANDLQGKRVNIGITPTVSIGSVDLHSVAQLYLGGPNNRLTSFVSVQHQESIAVPSSGSFSSLVPDIAGKSYHAIMDAIIAGVKTAYMHEKRPFFTLEIPEITPYYIGQFMQCAIIETIYLGHLLNINPFDQPQVELYKKETRKMLARE